MKKWIVLLLSALLVVSLVSCGKKPGDTTDNKTTPKPDSNPSTTVPDSKPGDTTPEQTKPDTTDPEKPDDAKTLDDMVKKLLEAVGEDNFLCTEKQEQEAFFEAMGLDKDQITSFVAQLSKTPDTIPDRVIILKVKEGYADTAVEKCNADFAKVVAASKEAGKNTEKTLGGRIYQSGDYVIYVIAGAAYTGEDATEEAALAKSEYEKLDNAIKELLGDLPENKAAIPE